MAKEDLKQTKNSFKVIGRVSRIDKDGAYDEGTAEKGKREGDTFRKLRFGVKTSETNEITAQMYDYEPTEIFMWNSAKREKDPNYKGDRIPYEEWEEKQDSLREEGYAVLQTRIGLTYDKDGKIESQGLPSFVASKEIYDNLNNGDSVVVEGEIRYSSWTNDQDKVIEQKTFTIKKVFKIKDVDFYDEKFEEVTYFEQELVYIDAEDDKKEKKVYVTGRTIDYLGNYHDTQFVVDYSDGDGGNDEGMHKLAEAFVKKFKFGDLLNVFGDALNRVVFEEVEDDSNTEEEELLASLGGKSKPKHAERYAARTYISEMQIHGVEAWDKKVYKESDFEKDELLEESNKKNNKKNDLSDELGGKGKKNSNPFDLDSDDGAIEINEDDLPF